VRALAISEQEMGISHPHTANSLSSLAGLYAVRGKYTEAELLYQRALRIYEIELGPKHPDTAQVMNNLAGLYHTLGHVAEAERLYILALANYTLAFGQRKPPSIRIIGENYANLLREQGREAEARQIEKSISGIAHVS
jgi:tetratricopeptide (TPR) repeat protein